MLLFELNFIYGFDETNFSPDGILYGVPSSVSSIPVSNPLSSLVGNLQFIQSGCFMKIQLNFARMM